MKLLKAVVAMTLSLSFASAAFADEAYDVVKKFTELSRPDCSKAQMLLEIKNKNGTVETREMIEYGMNEELTNVVFDIQKDSTKKYAGVRVLQAEKTNKEDDRWIYEPSLRNVRRIQTGERSGSFVGCEFTYNDMTIRKVDEDKHEMMNANATITVNGTTYNCWQIKSVPIKKNDIEYGYRICWYDKKSYLPVQMEYYDKKDPKLKIKSFIIEKIENVKGVTGKSYVLRRACTITNHITGRSTRVSVKNFEFDNSKTVNKKNFTTNWLMTGK